MSDFDKEAEREKLREKYENEEAERRATQQMSELLLQGATMTNAHCDDHGDPIFRYDGEQFCPTCRAEGQETVRADDDGGSAETGDAGDDDAGQHQGASAEAGNEPAGAATDDRAARQGGEDARGSGPADARQPGTTGDPDPSGRSPGRRRAGGDDARRSVAGADQPPRAERRTGGSARGERDEPDRSGRPAGRDRSRTGTGDLAEAEASLRRTLVRFAHRAEDADDPRRAREDLRVAREAAEALAALND